MIALARFASTTALGWLIAAALLASGQASCVTIVDFDEYRGGSSSAGVAGQDVGAGGQGAGGDGQGAGGDGEGGTGGFACAANLEDDPSNCGACNWDCAGGTCSDGVCQPVALDVPDSGWLAVQGEQVLVLVGFQCDGDGQDDVAIQAYPAQFAAGATPTATFPTLDSCALGWAVGPERAYYPPQDGAGVLEACTGTACSRVDYDLANNHINGIAATDDALLYVIGYKGGSALRLAYLTPGGVPESTTLLLATTSDTSLGGQFVEFDASTQNVWWMTVGVGGCVYREALASLDGGVRTCFAMSSSDFDPPVSTARIAVAPGGGLFALADEGGAGSFELHRIDDGGDASPFGPELVSGPLKRDGDELYVGYPQGGFNVLDVDTGEIRAGVFVPYAVFDLDAHHPDFVFFTGAGKLHRWRKLPPRP